MSKAQIAALVFSAVVLIALFANYGGKISDAYGAAFGVQLNLDATNENVAALEKRVEELEEGREIDATRITELEARQSR